MLYLTETSIVFGKIPIVYDVWIYTSSDTSDKTIHANPAVEGESFRACIVELDEHEACILAIKGMPLSKIARLHKRRFKRGGIKWSIVAELADIESLNAWW